MLLAIALGWTGWVSIALMDVRERLSRFEAKMDLLLDGRGATTASPNGKNP